MNLKFLLLYLCVFMFSGIISASFPQQREKRLQKLAAGADIIVTGKIIKQKSSWNKDKSRIYTVASLEVKDFLKGTDNNKTVTIIYPGGEVGSVGEIYSHMPRFRNQEHVLVFLKKDKKQLGYKVYEGDEGKIGIIKDSETGKEVTSSNVRLDYLKRQIKSYLKINKISR